MKRVLIALILFSLVLSACGLMPTGKAEDEADKSRLILDSTEKTELILVTMRHPSDKGKMENAIQSAASRFNQQNNHFHVTVVDYLQDGADGWNKGVRQLNTEVISGKYPDMVCFSQLSPFPFISKGLLLDMDKCIANDSTVADDDLVALTALRSFGGLFLLGSNITVDTLVAKQSRFGERYGWTMQEYLELEAQEDDDVWIIYNISHDLFLKEVSRRYTREAIDWEHGICEFDTVKFVELLKACSRIQDKLATEDNELIGLGASFVGEGKMIVAPSMTDQIYTLARDETFAGEKLSFIGWPTIDGRCGTDIRFQHPIGIISKSDQIEGCWEFIKYLLQSEPINYGIPIYRPRLLESIHKAEESEKQYEQMSPEQASRLLSLLDHIENMAIYDDTVIGIIMDESVDFFAGNRSAEETASIIQSKVSLYLSELQ